MVGVGSYSVLAAAEERSDAEEEPPPQTEKRTMDGGKIAAGHQLKQAARSLLLVV